MLKPYHIIESALCIVLVGIFIYMVWFCMSKAPSNPAPFRQLTCSRCGALCDESKMKRYVAVCPEDRDILLCPSCVYDQARTFINLCPKE